MGALQSERPSLGGCFCIVKSDKPPGPLGLFNKHAEAKRQVLFVECVFCTPKCGAHFATLEPFHFGAHPLWTQTPLEVVLHVVTANTCTFLFQPSLVANCPIAEKYNQVFFGPSSRFLLFRDVVFPWFRGDIIACVEYKEVLRGGGGGVCGVHGNPENGSTFWTVLHSLRCVFAVCTSGAIHTLKPCLQCMTPKKSFNRLLLAATACCCCW